MRAGWFPITLGACFAGAVVPFLVIEGAFFRPSTGSPDASERDTRGEAPEQDRRDPLSEHNHLEHLALPDAGITPVVRLIRASGVRRLATGRRVHLASEEWDADSRPTRLERVVAEARCAATSLAALAAPVQCHAPPLGAHPLAV